MSSSFPIRDPQSGAYSRGFFDEVVDREIERSRRHGSVLSVLSVVLVNWEEFAASLSAAALEGALHTLANTLQANVRLTDYLFRWEDDEFVVLLIEANLDGCKQKVSRLAATFRPWREGKGPFPQKLKVRVGAAVLEPGYVFPTVLQMARAAARDVSGELPALHV